MESLLSAALSYITGQLINVDGGFIKTRSGPAARRRRPGIQRRTEMFYIVVIAQAVGTIMNDDVIRERMVDVAAMRPLARLGDDNRLSSVATLARKVTARGA